MGVASCCFSGPILGSKLEKNSWFHQFTYFSHFFIRYHLWCQLLASYVKSFNPSQQQLYAY